MVLANSVNCLENAPLAAAVLVFFRFRYSALSPRSNAPSIACRPSAKPLKEASNWPSAARPISVFFGIALKLSSFVLASASSCCTMRVFSAAPALSPAARCAAAISARMVARSICTYESLTRLLCWTLRLSKALIASALERMLFQPKAIATSAATATANWASIKPVRTFRLLNIFRYFQ
ncbi:Uncharacterised protein [Achromobacter ruhlandii]|uniref:Uncharacterized protein n=1 Tax=Achromobacter ruhlandii TaxID=72557 RepID=A0ABM8M4W9_9BURK|nr:hypothetical protein LMG1864_05650 [Achromobacter ruhlandii]CAB3958387.1 hypothetical protein LMG7053_05620 [Achromobacter ruhlandii]CUJ72612.1 Uncharacterised protein [Achromobacter ruhlandii]